MYVLKEPAITLGELASFVKLDLADYVFMQHHKQNLIIHRITYVNYIDLQLGYQYLALNSNLLLVAQATIRLDGNNPPSLLSGWYATTYTPELNINYPGSMLLQRLFEHHELFEQ